MFTMFDAFMTTEVIELTAICWIGMAILDIVLIHKARVAEKKANEATLNTNTNN